MTAHRKQSDGVGRARPRLVPPQLGEVEARAARKDRDAERFRRGLLGERRRRLGMIAGNLLIFGLLVGVPLWRGHARATAAAHAYRAFARCMVGASVTGGLGDPVGEAQRLGQRLALPDRSWIAGCRSTLERVAPEPALFILPSVKAAEARVREAVAMLHAELQAFEEHVPGARMPDRPLRALRLLRGTLRKQVEAAGFSDREADVPSRFDGSAGLPEPARLPLFAAADANLSVWGDDLSVRVVALDATGVSYLEAEPGKPFTRARATRPRSLRAFVLGEDQGLLVWGTAPARCAERADGCAGKTTRLAAVRAPLLQLPDARSLALHLAGRADRSLALVEDGLLLASLGADRRAHVQRLPLGPEFAVGAELPALVPAASHTVSADEALLLSAEGDAIALGLQRDGAALRVLQLAPARQELTALSGADERWLVGCAGARHVGFAAGGGGRVRIGALQRMSARLQPLAWPELALSVQRPIDPEHANRDRVRSVCLADGVLLLARTADDALTAVACRVGQASCRVLSIARGIEHFAVLPTAGGALIAYAGGAQPQVRVRTLELASSTLSVERIPAACWTRGGLCGRPTLARLGQRILLLAPDKTDLLALESADQGQTWSAPPVL